MNCILCDKFDKEVETCGALPSELEDNTCLLRHLCYTLNYLTELIQEEVEDGEDWKK